MLIRKKVAMNVGQIRKAISGFYYVEDQGTIIQCKSRGVFRKRGIHPLVGDYVTYVPDGENDATITEVHERKNELIRPPIANIDQAILVFSVVEPTFSSYLLDRFLTILESYSIKPIICLTKIDLASPEDLKELESTIAYYEKIGYPVIQTYLGDEQLAEHISHYLNDKITVLAGQSGVGKSTLLNTILPKLKLKTGEISEALGRGKHTTRHVELLEVSGGLVADTPGFSTVEFDHVEKIELSNYFIEISEAAQYCKFRGCLHVNEPKCQVKKDVEEGTIASHRYEHYKVFLQEIIERKPRYEKYD